MGLLDLFRGAPQAEPRAARAITADGTGVAFFGLDDPALLDYLRTGSTSAAGIEVTVDRAMRNPAVFRSVWLLPGESRGDPATTTAPDLPPDVERAVIQLVGAAASASGRDMMVKSEDVEGVGSRSFYVQGSTASLPHPEAEATLAQYRRMAFA